MWLRYSSSKNKFSQGNGLSFWCHVNCRVSVPSFLLTVIFHFFSISTAINDWTGLYFRIWLRYSLSAKAITHLLGCKFVFDNRPINSLRIDYFTLIFTHCSLPWLFYDSWTVDLGSPLPGIYWGLRVLPLASKSMTCLLLMIVLFFLLSCGSFPVLWL